MPPRNLLFILGKDEAGIALQTVEQPGAATDSDLGWFFIVPRSGKEDLPASLVILNEHNPPGKKDAALSYVPRKQWNRIV